MPSKKVSLLALALLSAGGWGCEKFSGLGKGPGVSDSQIVATVGGKDITFGDWMRQVDLLRIVVPEGRGLDPNNAQQVSQALETLVNQQVVLAALRKANYTDATFDQSVQKQLVQTDLQLKEDLDQLERDLQSVKRLEKNYKDALKEYLLAQNYASTQRTSVIVTEKEIKDLYDTLAQKYKQAGRPMRPYKDTRELLQAKLQADKLMKNLQGGVKVDRKEEVIQKYLTSLSPSRGILGSGPSEPKADSKDTQELRKK